MFVNSPPPLDRERPHLLAIPTGFSLAQAIRISPIGLLPPLLYDPVQPAMQAVIPIAHGPSAAPRPLQEVLIRGVPGHDALLIYGLGEGPHVEPVLGRVRWMLGLDDDLFLFYHLCSRDRDLAWVAEQHAAHVLRSPTVFEDLVKTLVVTQKAKQAHAICQTLCDAFGSPTMLSRLAFPTEQQLALATEDMLAKELGLGSLGTMIHRLARRCADGQPHPETLRRHRPSISQALADDDEELFDDLVVEELHWQERVAELLLTLPGFGVRAVPKMLRLLGCFDLIELHHSAMQTFAKRYPKRRKTAESETAAEMTDRLLKRLDGFAIYRSLAQSILLLPPERRA